MGERGFRHFAGKARLIAGPIAESRTEGGGSMDEPKEASIRENPASLQMALISPKWLARRSSSAIKARSQIARGGISIPSAASTARAKAKP